MSTLQKKIDEKKERMGGKKEKESEGVRGRKENILKLKTHFAD